MNIKDIKVTYRSKGPNIKWEFLKKLHPTIHAIRSVSKHIKKEFGTDTRGTKHTKPKRVLDVKKLHQSYHAARHHNSSVGRKIDWPGDKAKDYTLTGGSQTWYRTGNITVERSPILRTRNYRGMGRNIIRPKWQ